MKAPSKSLLSAVCCIGDKMAIDDKYSRQMKYCGFPQDFKEKDSYKPDIKKECVNETGPERTPKGHPTTPWERQDKMKMEWQMLLEEEEFLKKVTSSDTALGRWLYSRRSRRLHTLCQVAVAT